jgi:hypothetical protein
MQVQIKTTFSLDGLTTLKYDLRCLRHVNKFEVFLMTGKHPQNPVYF